MNKNVLLATAISTSILILSACQQIKQADTESARNDIKDKSKSTQISNVQHNHQHGNPGDRKGHDMKEVVPREIIPESPILDIKAALNTFTIHPDFELQVIANEPLIYDPVAIQYDKAGRIWALEMTTFMPNTQADGEMKHESQIVVLTDTDNDGKMDKRQIVVEKILLPRALAFVNNGILWADHTQLYFSQIKEKNGQFSLIKTEVVDPDYAKGGNLEHKPNGLLYNLDNWYYSAKSTDRYRTLPLNAALPKDSKEIYRNQFWKMVKAKTEFRGQWGLSQDDYGRLYFDTNSSPIQTTSFLPNVAHRNPKHKFSKKLLTQTVGTNDVYPSRVTPGINRGYQENMYADGFKLKYHTAACGPVIYRGNQFPQAYYGIGLVQEPAGNLVKATKITEKNGVVSGQNLFDKQDIITSTDERFRPVNAYNAPDGTITIVDFYHGILQHRTFLTSYLANQIKMRDLERNKHIGRLYRLKYKNAPIPNVSYLDKLSSLELVSILTHDNGWHRDTAQQLLVMQQDKSVIPALKKLALNSQFPLAQIKALWTLEGLGEIDFELLKQVVKTHLQLANSSTLSDEDNAQAINSKIKRSVYRLVEQLPTNIQIKRWILAQAAEANSETAPILSLAAGTHQAWPALTKLINQFGVSDFTFAALAFHEHDYLESQQSYISAQVIDEITAVMNIAKPEKKSAKLTGELLASFKRGESLYQGEAACFGCHGNDGEGNSMVPPLNKSEWVVQSPERLAGILLRGLSGPITVNKTQFNSPMTMPGLGQNNDMSDQDLADISTYIRNTWDNSASAVSANQVNKVRTQTEQQTTPYTVETLNQQFK